MKTKCEIVQALLDEKKITAEDAVILLMGEKEYVYIPSPQPYPVSPWPYFVDPYPKVTWEISPVYCGVNPYPCAIAN